jgi:hypothetical protein
MVINSKDLYTYSEDLADTIFNEYSRYETLINKTLTIFMHQVEKQNDGMADIQKANKDNGDDH